MKFFSGLFDVINNSGEVINTLPVTALAKRIKTAQGWKYTIKVGIFESLDDVNNKPYVIMSNDDWSSVVKTAIAKDAEHTVNFVSFREVKF